MLDDLTEERPRLYNRITIVVFSLALTTIFGGVLYYQNLSEIRNKKDKIPLLFFCVLWNIISFKITKKFTSDFLLMFILPNFIGGLILSTAFWDHHFKNLKYSTRAIWIPLAFVFAIYSFFIGLRYVL